MAPGSDALPSVRRVLVVENPHAGTRPAGNRRAELTHAFAQAGAQATFVDVADAQALSGALRMRGAGRFDVIVADGGDGTISSLANRLVGDGRPLGIIPCGTFNYVARRYGVPEDPVAAARVVVRGRTIPIDAGDVCGRLFLNNCSIGLYTSIIDARERHERLFGRRRCVATLSAVATALRRHARPWVRIEHEGLERTLRASLVFVGANPLQLDGFDPRIAQRVREGDLAVIVVRAIDLRRLCAFAWHALRGAVIEAPEIDAVLARTALVAPRGHRIRAVVDGELCMLRAPLLLRRRTAALALRVPTPDLGAVGRLG